MPPTCSSSSKKFVHDINEEHRNKNLNPSQTHASRYGSEKQNANIDGVFQNALAKSISNQVAQLLNNEDVTWRISSEASKILAGYILNDKDVLNDSFSVETGKFKHSVKLKSKGGKTYNSLLNMIKSQRNWYLKGELKGDKIPLSPPATPLAHPQLVFLVADFMPSSTATQILLPTILSVPGMLQKPVTKSTSSILPLSQFKLDAVMKNNVEWILMDKQWRDWVKNSTTGYIEQKTSPSKISNLKK